MCSMISSWFGHLLFRLREDKCPNCEVIMVPIMPHIRPLPTACMPTRDVSSGRFLVAALSYALQHKLQGCRAGEGTTVNIRKRIATWVPS